MDFEDLKDGFLLEATELLDEAEEALLDMDSGEPFDSCYNKLFRSFHSLKGASGMFALDVLQDHMHKLETLLDGAESSLSKSNIDYFLGGVDAARGYFRDDTIDFEYISSLGEEPQRNLEKKRKEEIVAHVAENKHKNNSNGLVFVVDDEEIILNIICEILTDAGYLVRPFSDGKYVIDALANETPDLIVADINMPELDGISMGKLIKERGLDLPIIYVSAYVTKEIVLESVKSGLTHFIEKPFDEKVLLTLTSSVMHSAKSKKALSHSMDYILYQFSNHEEALNKLGKEKELKLMKEEIFQLIELKKSLK